MRINVIMKKNRNINMKVFILTTVCCSCLIVNHSFGKDITIIRPDFTNPNGSSIEETISIKEKSFLGSSSFNPINLEKVKSYNELKFLQDKYVRENYEGYRVVGESLKINNAGRIIQSLMIENDENEYKHVYFDVDDIFRKYRRLKNKDLAERVKELLKSDSAGKIKEISLYEAAKMKLLKTKSN